MHLFEKIDLARQGDELYYEDVNKAFEGKLAEQQSNLFKEYVYYTFPEKGYRHANAMEFYKWLVKI
jgi:hypothetical protein